MRKNKILDYFSLLKKHSLMGTSYLLVGNNFSLTKDIVKLVNCRESASFCNTCWDCKKIEEETHPDLFLIQPEPVTIKIEKIRESQSFLSLKSFRAKYKVVIVKGADGFSPEAANSFLKTLEEPPRNSFIIIYTSKLEGILPTIISRCRKIFLPSVETEIDTSSISKIKDFLQGEMVDFKNRHDFSSFLWALILLLRDRLISSTGYQGGRLLKNSTHHIVLRPHSTEDIEDILDNILRIYGAYNNINENLALNLIRTKLA